MTRNTNAADRDVLKSGQKPFAVVITCADSRVPPEIYFDQKLGDIFVIRNAGNIASTTALGSIEYAVEHLHSPLVVVVGHSSCGAVGGAFAAKGEHKGEHKEEHEGEHAAPPAENLQIILNTISPVIANSGTPDEGIHANIAHVVESIKSNKIVEHVKATVIGAYYNIESGEVSFKE
ncbi:MAG: carbonic anhydrase [Chitinispirillia bacterium]|nr:carbonic anhydrase [Chitinispirillia bacterium]MCL2242778.1 carbonic anhydrase [Chitinispirillia bacterium]